MKDMLLAIRALGSCSRKSVHNALQFRVEICRPDDASKSKWTVTLEVADRVGLL